MLKRIPVSINLNRAIRLTTATAVLVAAVFVFFTASFITDTLGKLSASNSATGTSAVRNEGVNDALLTDVLARQTARIGTVPAPKAAANPFATAPEPPPAPVSPPPAAPSR